MYLKSLELTGFKSFAKKGELTFNAPISAIVGPNGSGKSNIAEAFRFVLGEQSMKTLRSKRGEDLIFNGTPEVSRANRASAKLVFDNRERFLNIDFDEVTLERVVHRDGTNEYFLNGSSTRLKDTVELLAGAHIGVTGHHIISQGEADKILNASIKERKAMLEDALGLKIYQYKRQESERKLEKTMANMREVELSRREISPHLKFLKKQMEKIEKAENLKSELKALYQEYLKREQIYLVFNKREISSKQQPFLDRLEQLQIELNRAKDILEQSKNRDAKSDELIELEEKLSRVRREKDEVLRDLGRLEGEISSQNRLLIKQKQLAASDNNKSLKLSAVEELFATISQEADQAQAVSDLAALQRIIATIKEKFSQFLREHQVKSDDGLIKELTADIESLTSRRGELEGRINTLRQEEQALRDKYDEFKKLIEKEKDSNRDAEKAVFKIMSEQNELQAKLQTLSVAAESLRHSDEDYRRELTEAGVLVGRELLEFASLVVRGEDGAALSDQVVATEGRERQEARRRQIEKIKIRLEESGASGRAEIAKEFTEVSERDSFLERELADLEKSASSLKQLIDELEEKINQEFKEGIVKINQQFEVFFTKMFGGGSAGLTLVRATKRKRSDLSELSETALALNEDEALNAFVEASGEESEEGVDISVNLPRKKICSLTMLSGGERSLTSIALLFAMSQVNPPPFIILDETDAALDEANSKKYGDMIETLSQYSQLILITHNRETMSRAGVIYGVTMGAGGVSKLLSIAFDEAVAVAK